VALSLRCPKCETDVRAGARRCPLCGTPLRLEGFKPGKAEEGEPVVDPLLELFERDEIVRMCPRCLCEHVTTAKTCRGCRIDLVPTTRDVMEATILERPVESRSLRATAPPPKVPADLVRIHVCAGPEEAARRLAAMKFLAIEVWMGSDSLDADPDPALIGMYVRRHDVTVARYILEGPDAAAEDPFTRAERVVPDARARALATARAYLKFGKFRRVIEMLEPLDVDPEAQDLMAEALLGRGRIRDAERRAERAMQELPPGPGRARASFLGGVLAALGHDGRLKSDGARLDVAVERLMASAREAPRDLEAGKALVEVCVLAGRNADAARELDRLRRVNANLTGLDGWWRARAAEFRVV
jgi:Double zinc ribbon